MMSKAFDRKNLWMDFTSCIVKMTERIKIHPMPRITWPLREIFLASGIIIVMILNLHLNILSNMTMSAGSKKEVIR